MSLDPALQTVQIERTTLPGNFLPTLEDSQRWNAADIEASGKLLFCFGIELGKARPWFHLTRSLREVGCHRSARPAPRRPEINDYRQVVASDVAVEIRAA